MTKKRLFEDIRQNPARIYRVPGDVLRDRRFTDAEKLAILQAWRDGAPGPQDAADIGVTIQELERRLHPANGHAAE